METLTWINLFLALLNKVEKFMKQIQELMTQGHADEQSPDYAVTQMSEDVEEFGAHAPTLPGFRGLLSVPQHRTLCQATSRSICLKLPTKC